jgi:hypothetical protein
MKPLRIYVAGPYSPHNCDLHDASRIAQLNTDIAVAVGNALADKGHYVFVPHLTHYMHISASCKVNRAAWYYELDNTFLERWANALYYIAPSFGADAELALAEKLGYKIFVDLERCPNCDSHNNFWVSR